MNHHRDDLPLLSAAASDTSKYASSTLNPDASAFSLNFSPSNHYQQTRMNSHKNNSHENACSTSDYYSQSGLPSSGSSSIRSAASLSPSILSAISPSMLLPFDSPTDEQVSSRRTSSSSLNEKRVSTSSSLNLFIGDKILSLYGSTNTATTPSVDTNNNQSGAMNLNLPDTNPTSAQFESKDTSVNVRFYLFAFRS